MSARLGPKRTHPGGAQRLTDLPRATCWACGGPACGVEVHVDAGDALLVLRVCLCCLLTAARALLRCALGAYAGGRLQPEQVRSAGRSPATLSPEGSGHPPRSMGAR